MPRFQTFHANMHAETTPTILHWIVASLLEVSMPTDWFAVCRPRRKSLQFLRHLRCRLGRTWSLSLWWGTIRPTIGFPFVLFRWRHCTLRLWEGNQVHIDTRIMHQPLECLVQRELVLGQTTLSANLSARQPRAKTSHGQLSRSV